MSLQSSVQDAAAATASVPGAMSFMRRHRVAQAKLEKAFDEQSPVVLMTGVDSVEQSRIIGAFVAGLDAERTKSVHLRQTQESALVALGEINRAIGFDPKDMAFSDLQTVLTLFLEHQCKAGRRTVLCVEKADRQSMWLLDCLARLIEAGEVSHIGRNLLVILSGTDRLTDVLQNATFDIITRSAGKPIRLAPYSIFETREFVRQLSMSAGIGEIESMFEFDAIERLHRLSGGIPRHIARLVRECADIVEKTRSRAATSQIVAKAARNLRAHSARRAKIVSPKPAAVQTPRKASRRLVIRCPRKPPQEYSLKAGRFMVGRASTADICLPSLSVSRRHALLIDTGKMVQVLDLGGANGTYAGSERISEVTLDPGSVLTLGDCEIEYTVD